jgi:hypothetical protein
LPHRGWLDNFSGAVENGTALSDGGIGKGQVLLALVASWSLTAHNRNWQDRHGRLPHPIQDLLTIARIKAEAASNQITSVEISWKRLM